MDHGKQTVSINPGRDEIIAYVPQQNPRELMILLRRARAAQAQWATWETRQRARALRALGTRLLAAAEDLARHIVLENGMTETEALVSEILPAVQAVSVFARRASARLRDRRLRPSSILSLSKHVTLSARPWGVVGLVTHSDCPLIAPFNQALLALMVGNAVILNAAPEGHLIGRALEHLFGELEIPAGILAQVNLPPEEAGAMLLAGGIDKLCFSGSRAAGRKVAAAAAAAGVPCLLTTGSNDPMLVCVDADLDAVASGALRAAFRNGGPSGGGVKRLFADYRICDPLLRRLATGVARLRVGPGGDLGAQTTRAGMARTREQIAEALTQGAHIYAQASPPREVRGQYLPATLLTRVDPSMRILREEVSGPLLAVLPVAGVDEAIRLANDPGPCFSASIWSADAQRAAMLCDRLRARVIMINDHAGPFSIPEIPWACDAREMFQVQALVQEMRPGRDSPFAFPHDDSTRRRALALIRALGSPHWHGRMAGWLRARSGSRKS